MEYSVVLVKPDGMEKKLVGEIISRFEKAGLNLSAIKMVKLTDEVLNSWYAHHKDKSFFGDLVSFMKSRPIVAMVWEGAGVIEKIREICGATDPKKAAPGTIRADFGGPEVMTNIIHASDSVQGAEKEKGLIFKEEVF